MNIFFGVIRKSIGAANKIDTKAPLEPVKRIAVRMIMLAKIQKIFFIPFKE
jgi:hypothetical protein